jgi:hypothetical protein
MCLQGVKWVQRSIRAFQVLCFSCDQRVHAILMLRSIEALASQKSSVEFLPRIFDSTKRKFKEGIRVQQNGTRNSKVV